MVIIDDNYIIGPYEEIFRACKGFMMDLNEFGLKFQPGPKSSAPPNGALFGVISQTGQSLMHTEMKALNWQSATSLLALQHL
jgi:hypothetical protein